MRAESSGPAPAGDTQLKSLEEHAAVYAAVVASALDAVIVVDEDGVVAAINPAAEAMFGYARDEALGRSIGSLIVPDHLKAAHEAGFARYRQTREPHVLGRRVELEALCKDGRVIPVELAITEVSLPDRRLFTANLRDLSAAKEAAAEIERHREALHQSEKLAALGSLLAGVAHELNNPLSIVLGQATMLREEIAARQGEEGLRARADKIEAAAERCARVVRSFLSIARQRKAETRPVDLAPLLDASIDLVLYGLQSAGIGIERDYYRAHPQILADPDQVQQIVVNLLVNAAQALEEADGPRKIKVSVEAAEEGPVRLVVADSGPGVPKDIAQRIFEPFFTTKPHGAGTGIGLSVSRGLAQAQGGDLLLGPDEGLGGAAFELVLPVAEGTAEAPGGAETPVAAPVVPGRRAMVIDDEAEVAGLLAEALEKAGYACEIASSGREAQERIAAGDGIYDAIVCDLRMADVDGPAFYRWLEIHHRSLADRILFVTGDALGPAAGRFLAGTGRPVLEKPFPPNDVVRVVAGFPPRT